MATTLKWCLPSCGHYQALDSIEGPPLLIDGLSISVESKTRNAHEVVRRIGAFCDTLRSDTLAKLDAATVADHAKAIVTRLLEPPKRLGGETDMWCAKACSS